MFAHKGEKPVAQDEAQPRDITISFHTPDLPWRFSGKLHIQGSHRASSCVSRASWQPLPALPCPSWDFSAPGRSCFHCTEMKIQLKGMKLPVQLSASQEQGMRSHPSLQASTSQHWPALLTAGCWEAKAWEKPKLGSNQSLGAAPPALWAVPVWRIQALPVLPGQSTKCGKCLWFPSHKAAPSLGSKDIQLLTWKRGTESEVEHSQVFFSTEKCGK